MGSEIDKKILDTLTPAEKQAVLSILKEYEKDGSSKTFTDLLYADYSEIPVDIETFLTDDNYLGKAWKDAEGNSKLYPYWLKRLKELFPNNRDISVNNAIFSGARGLGKSEIAVAIGAYLMYRVMCLKDPLQHFHMKSTEKVCFAFMNITKTLAEAIGISKFQNTIQMSPWFLSRGTLSQRNNMPYWTPPEPINIIIGSQASHVIGQPIYFAFFDEISFIRNQDIDKQKKIAIDMIDTAIGGMKTRFIYKGQNPTLLCLASSKRSEKSFLEEHMKLKLQSEKENVLIVDEAVWKVKPVGTYGDPDDIFYVALGNKFLVSQIIPDGDDLDIWRLKGFKILKVPSFFKASFKEDIDRSLCDFAGISSSEISKYISGVAVSDCLSREFENPFSSDILEIGNDPADKSQYYNFFDMNKVPKNFLSKPLFVHLDMSISGDMTGIAGVWISGKKTSSDGKQERDLTFQEAFSVSIKAPKGRQISFEKNRNFVRWLKEAGFRVKEVTSDTFQSYDLQQQLKAEGFSCSILSVDRVDSDHICRPYQYLKSTIYEGRIQLLKSKRLIDELVDLERNINTGKVDHPPNGCFTGDTKVQLTDGRSLTFLELVAEDAQGKTNYVYSINLDTKKIEPKKILKAWKTATDQPLVKITLDNGEDITCTLNHRFMLRNGEYIEAEDLLPGDSLMPLYLKYPEKGGLKKYRMYYEPFEDKWHFEHRSFATEILDERHLVHHKDCNPDNNNPNNLVWCSRKEHQKIHALLQTGAQSDDAKAKRINSLSKWHSQNKDTSSYALRNEKVKQSLYKHNIEKYGHSSSLDRLAHISEIEDTFGVNYSELSKHEKDSLGVKLSRMKNPAIAQNTSQAVSAKHKEGRYLNAEKALASHNEQLKMLRKLFPTVDKEEFRRIFGFDYDELPSTKKPVYVNRYRQALYEIKNHTVVKVEYLATRADVYDIEVEDNHNFALSAGVFVHNSKDAADALCGATFTASKYAEEFAYDYGEGVNEMINLNINPQQNLLKQLTVDFEKELANMGPVLGNPNTKGKPPLATLDMFEDKQEKDYPSLEGNTLIW